MTNTAEDLTKEEKELSCVVIPTVGENLLLPNVSVAEIVPWRRIKALQDGPRWCLGFTGWRGLTIPVLHYAGFADADHEVESARCLVVMNRARKSDGLPFYAYAAQSLPYMVQLGEEDLEGEAQTLGPADVMKVSLGQTSATIPDLEFVESKVKELHSEH